MRIQWLTVHVRTPYRYCMDTSFFLKCHNMLDPHPILMSHDQRQYKVQGAMRTIVGMHKQGHLHTKTSSTTTLQQKCAGRHCPWGHLCAVCTELLSPEDCAATNVACACFSFTNVDRTVLSPAALRKPVVDVACWCYSGIEAALAGAEHQVLYNTYMHCADHSKSSSPAHNCLQWGNTL